MVNINKLKGKMAEKGFSQLRLGEVAGISLSTVSQRFKNNGANFTVEEVEAISTALELSIDEINDIFFSSKFVRYAN